MPSWNEKLMQFVNRCVQNSRQQDKNNRSPTAGREEAEGPEHQPPQNPVLDSMGQFVLRMEAQVRGFQ